MRCRNCFEKFDTESYVCVSAHECVCIIELSRAVLRHAYIHGACVLAAWMYVCVIGWPCHAYCNSCRLCFVYTQSRVHKYAFHDRVRRTCFVYTPSAPHEYVYSACVCVCVREYTNTVYSFTRNKTHSKTVYLICVHLS